LRAPGEALRFEERPDPRPGEGETVVELRCAALNHRDVWIQKGTYHVTRYPVIPGADGAGVVSAVGKGVDSAWLGREVIINPGVGWGASEKCARDDFATLGTPTDGTLAEKLLIPATQLNEKPPHLDWIHAAALPLSGLTAFRAVFPRAGLRKGERVLVTGAGGGVALFALQYAVAAGAKVFATSSSEQKLARVRELGVAGTANYREADWAEKLKRQAGGFDVIIDSASGPDFGKLVELAAPGGRIAFFGTTAGSAAAFDMRTFFRKQLTLLGTKMGSLGDFAAMVEFVNKHRIEPIVDRVMPLAEVNAAYAALDRGEQFGKIVFTISGPDPKRRTEETVSCSSN
jgi:NADPH:quinone reductase-like Zn-dependent oxidoreductase